MTTRVKREQVANLRAHPDNPRKISSARLEQLKRSLEADPQMLDARPLIALPDGTVIAGNQRLHAVMELGWDTVPVAYVDLNAERAREWMIRDNRGYGEDEDERLAELLAGLQEAGRDLDLLGIDPSALDKLLRSIQPEPPVDPDDVPPLPDVPDSKLGEVYELGRHRLMCGDAFGDLGSLLSGVKVDAVFTDPPYGMGLDVRYDQRFRKDSAHRPTGNRFDRVIGDDKPFDPSPLFKTFHDVEEQFWFGADYYRQHLPDGGSWIVWDKRASETMNLDAVVGSSFELCWSKSPHRREIARILWSGHHGMQRDDTSIRVHPTQKPTALAEWILSRHTKPKQVVLDPFAGSGFTLIACEQTDRRAMIAEIDPAYCDVIRNRYQAFTAS